MDERHAYWLAALIDGEGSIVVRIRKGRTVESVAIVIAQNDRRLLDRARSLAGAGAIYGGQGPRKTGHQLQIFRQADVLRVLEAVEPILVLKADKARQGIAILRARLGETVPLVS